MKYFIKIAFRQRIIFYMPITDDHKCSLREITCAVYNKTMLSGWYVLRVACHYCPRDFWKVRQLGLHDEFLFDVSDCCPTTGITNKCMRSTSCYLVQCKPLTSLSHSSWVGKARKVVLNKALEYDIESGSMFFMVEWTCLKSTSTQQQNKAAIKTNSLHAQSCLVL